MIDEVGEFNLTIFLEFYLLEYFLHVGDFSWEFFKKFLAF